MAKVTLSIIHLKKCDNRTSKNSLKQIICRGRFCRQPLGFTLQVQLNLPLPPRSSFVEMTLNNSENSKDGGVIPPGTCGIGAGELIQ
jgi:hypothetical protein